MAPLLKRVLSVLLAVCGVSSIPAAALADWAADFADVDRYLETGQRQMGIPGMALVIVHGDKVVHARGFGRADRSGRHMTTSTPVIIASISKPIAATAVMQLAEQGKIDLDAPVIRYIPWFRVKSPDSGAGITVRHLLNQTSGIPRRAGYPPLTDRRIDTLEKSVRDLARFEALGAPGAQFTYSNGNFAVLGLLVESVSGQTYEAYVRTHILEPLGMAHTYFTESDAQTGGLAQGYTPWFGFPVPVQHPFLEHATPYYGLVSTADDLARFSMAFLNQGRVGDVQLLSPESVRAMLTPLQPDGPYGLGWWTSKVDGRLPVASHGGDAHGFRNELILRPESGWGVIFLTNENAALSASAQISELAWGVFAMLEGIEPYPPAPDYWRKTGAITLAAVLMLIALVLWQFFLADWAAAYKLGRVGLLPAMILPGAISVVVGAAVLLWGPRQFLEGNWPIALPTQPDVAWTGLLWSCGLVLAGAAHLLRAWINRGAP